jgi:hypothetical protein
VLGGLGASGQHQAKRQHGCGQASTRRHPQDSDSCVSSSVQAAGQNGGVDALAQLVRV